jgi:hypothetical protein
MYVYKTDALSKIFPPEKEYVYDCITDIKSGLERTVEIK